MQPDGRCADVVFADAHGVKHTLHAYPEQPLRVRRREIIVFRKYTKVNRLAEGRDKESDMDMRTSSRTARTGRDHDDGAEFVSN